MIARPRDAAVDIGGANLKLAHAASATFSEPFAVWRAPERLESELRHALAVLPRFDRLAVTMTAELCDCFTTKREGVLTILYAVHAASAYVAPDAELRVWRNNGRFASFEKSCKDPLPVAAANWLALAEYAATLVPREERALLADLGSTTLDLVPIEHGSPAPRGRTDTERLLTGELVYTGVRRTPIFALANEVPWRDTVCPLIPELFATSDDVFLVLGETTEDALDHETCDGLTRTREAARGRLARSISADLESFSADDGERMATHLAGAQRTRIAEGARRATSHWTEPPSALVVSGEGEAVVARTLRTVWPHAEIVSLSDAIGPEASRAACARALVELLGRA